MTSEADERRQRRAVYQGLGPDDRPVRRGATFHDFAAAEVGIVGGRFATESSQRISGSKPLVQYPAGAAWAQTVLPDERPIDIDVSAVPIVGEPHEVAASLVESQTGEGVNNVSPPADQPCGELQSSNADYSLSVVETGSPPPKQRRRKR